MFQIGVSLICRNIITTEMRDEANEITYGFWGCKDSQSLTVR